MCQCSTLRKVSNGVRGVDFQKITIAKHMVFETPLSKTHVFLIGLCRFCCKTRAFWSVANRTWPPQNVTWPASEPAQPYQSMWTWPSKTLSKIYIVIELLPKNTCFHSENWTWPVSAQPAPLASPAQLPLPQISPKTAIWGLALVSLTIWHQFVSNC